MDFFGAQEEAKNRTKIAIGLFALGVLATAVAIYTVVIWVLFLQGDAPWLPMPLILAQTRPEIFGWSIAGISVVILAASFLKISSMGAGGVSVAQLLGARFIDLRIDGEKERQLQNIVEEMAIASGYGIPQVGILEEEQSINAFAAALTPRDAVVVVTRGALEKLNRDELQAVVAHEFSHLLNGDSRLNINLAGWVFGLFFLTIIGRRLMRVRGKKSGGIVLIGLAVFVVGAIGWLFGRVIQALISRQREYLADASSVQFTRNPRAMVASLGKIALGAGSAIRNPLGTDMAHFFFSSASSFDDFMGLFATHPPLGSRMRAIDANYEQILESLPKPSDEELLDGKTISPIQAAEARYIKWKMAQEAAEVRVPENAADGINMAVMALTALVASSGSISSATLNSLSGVLAEIPDPLKAALNTPAGARAVILGLVLPVENRQALVESLQPNLAGEVYRPLYELSSSLAGVAVKQRIMLAQLACTRVKRLLPAEKIALAQDLEKIISMDGKLTAFEALYVELIRHWLELDSDCHKIVPVEAASRVLSFLYAQQGIGEPLETIELAKITEGLVLPRALRPIKYISMVALREALPSLLAFSFLQRRELLIAFGRVLKLDEKFTEEEVETLRALAGLMDCPMPSRG